MRAAVFHQAGQPLAIEQVADPVPAPGEVILSVARAGICGSDLHVTEYGLIAGGTVPGHEFAGEIVALGAGVGGEWRIGDRVTALPIDPCHDCEACHMDLPALCSGIAFAGTSPDRPGGYAELVAARAAGLQRLPAGVTIEEGAMVEPLAVAHHTVEMAHIAKGEAVLVIGAGPIGAAVALFARLAGAAHVVVSEFSPERRARVLEVGATAVIDPAIEDVAARFHALAGRTPQVVFECVGIPGLMRQAIGLAGVRGRVMIAGVCFGDDTIAPLVGIGKELSVQFTHCYTDKTFETVIGRIACGEAKVSPLHTQTVGFGELPTMFESLRSAPAQCKVLIDPGLRNSHG